MRRDSRRVRFANRWSSGGVSGGWLDRSGLAFARCLLRRETVEVVGVESPAEAQRRDAFGHALRATRAPSPRMAVNLGARSSVARVFGLAQASAVAGLSSRFNETLAGGMGCRNHLS